MQEGNENVFAGALFFHGCEGQCGEEKQREDGEDKQAVTCEDAFVDISNRGRGVSDPREEEPTQLNWGPVFASRSHFKEMLLFSH